jgi:hypothetical protein
MSINGTPTVWILGAGFSRSLGGPLLADLFRQQHAADLRPVIGQALAAELTWVQHLFRHGTESEQLWGNAEDFLAYLDEACGPTAVPIKKARLDGLIARAPYSEGPWRNNKHLGDAEFERFKADPQRSARWALAAECDLFLDGADTKSESWKPYAEWARSLTPEHDTVVTFNYDTVLERLDPDRFEILQPGDARLARDADPKRFDKVPVFKLHGSTNWVTESEAIVTQGQGPLANNAPRAIAPPGRTKTAWANDAFAPLWRAAINRIESAWSFAILGYGFPKTDAEARIRVLAAIDSSSHGNEKRLEIVLGPDTTRPESRRVLELIRRRMGHSRRTLVDVEADEYPRQGNEYYSIVTNHPLWVEDFIGDYHRRTKR